MNRLQDSKFFPEIHGNFGFGCMRLPMDGGKVDYDEFTRMADAFIDAGFSTRRTDISEVSLKPLSATVLRKDTTEAGSF